MGWNDTLDSSLFVPTDGKSKHALMYATALRDASKRLLRIIDFVLRGRTCCGKRTSPGATQKVFASQWRCIGSQFHGSTAGTSVFWYISWTAGAFSSPPLFLSPVTNVTRLNSISLFSWTCSLQPSCVVLFSA